LRAERRKGLVPRPLDRWIVFAGVGHRHEKCGVLVDHGRLLLDQLPALLNRRVEKCMQPGLPLRGSRILRATIGGSRVQSRHRLRISAVRVDEGRQIWFCGRNPAPGGPCQRQSANHDSQSCRRAFDHFRAPSHRYTINRCGDVRHRAVFARDASSLVIGLKASEKLRRRTQPPGTCPAFPFACEPRRCPRTLVSPCNGEGRHLAFLGTQAQT
jgi:hypothetical protein